MSYIYKTTNLINNKIYIGKRNGNFDIKYLGSGIAITHAIKKYGKINFKVEAIVYEKDTDKLNILEKQYIVEYRQKLGDVLNKYLKDGWELGRGPKFKEISSISKKGKENPMFGKGYLIKGSKNGMFGKYGEQHQFFGKHHTDEANEKNRQSHLGKRAWNKGLTTKVK